jgi:hypothetical protein
MSQSHSPRQFHYESDGVIHGPVLARDLKALATAGKLLPTDTVWELETGRRFPAAAIGGLFPGVPIAPMGDTKPKANELDNQNDRGGSTTIPLNHGAVTTEESPKGATRKPLAYRNTEKRDVFISYSSKEQFIADAICGALEREKIKCWIAWRDNQHGRTSYGESIIDAINECHVMVVILSSASNVSPYVLREVERAVSKGVPIVPFRVEDVKPSRSLEFYLSAPNWLDAFSEPLEKHVARLIAVISVILIGSSCNSELKSYEESPAISDKSSNPKSINGKRDSFGNQRKNDVFISYSSKDKTIAGAVLIALEHANLKCWIAPRDIQPGIEYAESIENAMRDSRVMILVLSTAANAAQHILREAELARSRGIVMCLFRVEDTVLSQSLESVVGRKRCVDAFLDSIEASIADMLTMVQEILESM